MFGPDRSTYLRLLLCSTNTAALSALLSVVCVAFLCLLYGENWDFLLYYSLLAFVFLLLFVIRRAFRLRRILQLLQSGNLNPEFYPQRDAMYLQALNDLECQEQKVHIQLKQEQSEYEDYFAFWAHQAKLPAAALKLLLDNPHPNLSAMKEQVQRMENSIQSAMAFVRLNSDSTDYSFAPLNLEEIVRKTIRTNAASFISHKMKIDVDMEPIQVRSDEKWVGFIVEQVLSNALKYCPENSTVTVCTHPEQHELVIADNGPGIAAKDLPRLFEKGYTGGIGHNSSLSSGVGLYLCHEIAQRMNCSLRIESQTGQGTCVILRFPAPDRFERISHSSSFSSVR